MVSRTDYWKNIVRPLRRRYKRCFFTSDSSPFASLIGCDEKQNDFFITVILWVNLSSYIIKRENHTVQSVAAQSIIRKFLKRLCMDLGWKSINGFLWALRLATISLRFNSTQKPKKSFLKNDFTFSLTWFVYQKEQSIFMLKAYGYPSTTKIGQWWPWIPFSQIVAHGTYLEGEYIKSKWNHFSL